MYRPRVIPLLLLKNKGLVKTVKFKNPVYIGDPINAVKIFNDLKADELIFLDITASKEKRTVSCDIVKNIADEAFMPFAVGGGINSIEQIKRLINLGAEKVVINTAVYSNPNLIIKAAELFGSQSIVVSIDVKRNIFGKYKIMIFSGTVKINTPLEEYIIKVENLGAGEIIINSIDNDGYMNGYNIELIKKVTDLTNIPVVACGGAGNLQDLWEAYKQGHASAVAAGSLFVFHGKRRAVLINYPERNELYDLFDKEKY